MESRVAEHLQPMRMPLACQQFGGAFADSFGSVIAEETPVIQEEP